MKWLLMLSSLVLAGCLSQSPAPNIYVLNTPKTEVAASRIERDLEIASPTAAPGLETERIALKQSSTSFDYFADSRWPSTLPEMVQSTLVRTIEQQGLVKSASNDETGIAADDILSITIQDFQAEYKDKGIAPLIHITLSVKLSDAATQKVFGSFIVEESVQAEANSMEKIVAAFDAGFQKTLGKITSNAATILAQNAALQLPTPTE